MDILNIVKYSNIIKVHSLTADPDKCYEQEEKNDRYKKLKKVNLDISSTEKKLNCIRFVCISDTHNQTDKLINDIPCGDVLIHGGDFTQTSAKEEIEHFNEFLRKVKDRFKHIVVIAGNHDLTFDSEWIKDISKYRRMFGRHTSPLDSKESKKLLTNCVYLEDEAIELYGIKIYGSPWQPEFCDWGFNETRGEHLLEKWNCIPDDTDILITHGPPLGIGDLCHGFHGNCRVGCAELLTTVIDRVKPKYHIFGHIHEDYGTWDDGTTKYINASICSQREKPINKPVVFDYDISS